MAEALPLPELARSLRSLGAARDAAGEAAHEAVFAALLDARRRAAHAPAREIVALFRGATIAAAMERAVEEAATSGTTQPAVGRARSAAARELLDPVRAALASLDQHGVAASAAAPGDPAWTSWLIELRLVFARADEACAALARLLSSPVVEAKPRRWFGQRGR